MEVCSKYHLGHMCMETLEANPDFLCQIDAATGEQMTNAEARFKTIKLAKCLRNMNMKPGDVLAFSGKNHIDIYLPFFAALFNGYPISAVDPQFKYDEIKALFKITRPKIAFCPPESHEDYTRVVQTLELDTKIVTFGKGETTLSSFINEFEDINTETKKDFRVAEFDIDKVYAFLTSTSGTTGRIKAAAIKHKVMAEKMLGYLNVSQKIKDDNRLSLNLSPVNWMSSYYCALAAPYVGDCILMTSNPDDFNHVIEIINKYRPKMTMFGPSLVMNLLERIDEVDMSSFNFISIAGSRCRPEVFAKIQSRMRPNAIVLNVYGLTETIGPCFLPVLKPVECCGRPHPLYKVKLVDPDTGIEIKEPIVPGEFWCKGAIFSEYYNNPEETAKSITADGYFKTGDLLYRDEEDNYFYVDRIKGLIKYRNYHVLPSELEDIIRECPAVRDVCVIGIDDNEDGQVPAACVVLHDGAHVTAQEIKDLVSSKLSKAKHLRGGVIFLKEFPLTTTGKIMRKNLLKIAMESTRE